MPPLEIPPTYIHALPPPSPNFNGISQPIHMIQAPHAFTGAELGIIDRNVAIFVQALKKAYAARRATLQSDTLNELATHKAIHRDLRPGVYSSARNDIVTTAQFIDTKMQRINQHFLEATKIDGQYPDHRARHYILAAYRERGRNPAAQNNPNILTAPFEHALRSSMELSLESEAVRVLNRELIPLNHVMDSVENTFRPNEAMWIDSLQFRLNSVDNQRVIAFRQLPPFLQREILPNPNSPDYRPLTEKLLAYRNVFDHAAYLHRLQINAYSNYNPEIIAPLSAFELDALRLLLSEQAPGSNLQDYHRSLFHQETARHLTEASAHYASLQARAQDLTQNYVSALAARDTRITAQRNAEQAARQQAQQQAEAAARAQAQQQAESAARAQAQHRAEAAAHAQAQQQAQDAARQAAEALANQVAATLSKPGAVSIYMPASTAAISTTSGNFAAALAESTLSALASTIRHAIASLGAGIAASAGALLSGLAVGAVALLWPSTLARSERRTSLLLPLTHVTDLDEAAVETAAASGQPLALSHAINLRTTDDGVAISVVAAPRDTPFLVPVVEVQLNHLTGAYQAVASSSPTVITVTPIVQPGDASTELPATYPASSTIPGPQIALNDFAANTTPGYQALDVEIFILRYPAHTGIPSVYLAVQKPPVEVGEVGRYKDLAARSKKDGIDIDHIPSQKALTKFFQSRGSILSPKKIKQLVADAGAVAISSKAHRAYSETFGGRNTDQKSSLDAQDLKQAIDSNLAAYGPAFKELGMTDKNIQDINEKLHKLAPFGVSL